MKRLMILGVCLGLGLVSCNTVPAYEARPMLTASGAMGFSVSGVASYTNDRTAAEREIRKVLVEACGGPIVLSAIAFQEANSIAGVPHLAYSASAECK